MFAEYAENDNTPIGLLRLLNNVPDSKKALNPKTPFMTIGEEVKLKIATQRWRKNAACSTETAFCFAKCTKMQLKVAKKSN